MSETALINCDALRRNLHAANQVVLDASYFLPRQNRDAYREYTQSHIPGAQFFDIDQVADTNQPLAHTLPDEQQFALSAGRLGIDHDTLVIVYDNNHFFASARVWWMFRVFGHEHVQVVDGGLGRWRQLAFPEDAKPATPRAATFRSRFNPDLYCNLQQMKQIQRNASRQIIDTRSRDSYLGRRRPHDRDLPAGHIPGSVNIPYAGLTDPERHTLLPDTQLRMLLAAQGIDPARAIVASCGTGVSAAVLALALYQLGKQDIPVYDGSWAEWGRQPDTPKQTAV